MFKQKTREISIHALRVEGDAVTRSFKDANGISIHALRVEGDSYRMRHLSAWSYISIHALRVEGDYRLSTTNGNISDFYPRPPGGGRLCHHKYFPQNWQISIHALRVEGDNTKSVFDFTLFKFLSTPSGWRATAFPVSTGCRPFDFYPRPPGGGRRVEQTKQKLDSLFLSTPSGWRATGQRRCKTWRAFEFLSTPSGWRATKMPGCIDLPGEFLSTPSGWRATSSPVPFV